MAKVLVVGDVMLDILIEGQPTRLAPDAPWAPVIRADSSRLRLGGAGFVASVMARLGHDVLLVGAVADDWAGRLVEELASAERVVLLPGESNVTTLKLSVVADQPPRYFPLCRGDVDATAADFSRTPLGSIGEYDVLICADYAKGVFDCAEFDSPLMRWAPMRIADPKPRNAVRFRGFDILVPNDKEATMILGGSRIRDLPAACARLEKLLGCSQVLITCNGEGVATRGGSYSSANEWHGRPVRSVSGAGDVFTSVLADRIAGGIGVDHAVIDAESASRHYSHTGELPGHSNPRGGHAW